MTTYNTNFGSYTAAAQPSDWTARWVTSNVTWLATTVANTDGGKVLRKTSTATARRLLSWDAVDGDANRANSEILARVRTSSSNTDQIRLQLRGSGAAASESAYSFIMGSGTTLTLHKFVAGVSTNLTTATYAYSVNTWYYVRFRVNGTTLSAKVWKETEEEPSAWTFTTTDSAISAAGWVGVGNGDSGGTMDVDFLSIGTNGDTAPYVSNTGTTISMSQAVMEVANLGAPAAVLSQAVMEVANLGAPAAVLSQAVMEVALGISPTVRLSQMVVEVAVANVTATAQQPIVTIVC